MALAEKLAEDMKAALKAGEKLRLGALRMAVAAIKQEALDSRATLSDTDVIRIIEKLIKRGRDAEAQFRAGGREAQAAKEAAEIDVLGEYLPEPLSEAELDALIEDVMAATGAGSVRDMGKVMGLLKQRAAGRIDMGAAHRRVQELLRQIQEN